MNSSVKKEEQPIEKKKEIKSWKIKNHLETGKEVEVTWSDFTITVHKSGDKDVPEDVKLIAPGVFPPSQQEQNPDISKSTLTKFNKFSFKT